MAKEIKDEVRVEVDAMKAAGKRPPHLTAVLVGEDPASRTYVKNKMSACKYTGQSCFVSTDIPEFVKKKPNRFKL